MTTIEDKISAHQAELSVTKQALLAKRLRGQAAPRMPRIARREARGAIPLSFAQQQLWFFAQLEPLSPLYNLPLLVRLNGRLDVEALSKSLMAVVVRHEILRARFRVGDHGPEQFLVDPPTLPFQQLDLRRRSEEDRETEARRLLSEEARRPFNLAADPLARAMLIRTGEQEWYLLLVMHHIVFDGWSWGVLARELNQLYPAFAQGRPAELPELPIQYADYAAWQAEFLTGTPWESLLDYWRRQLANAPANLELPGDHARPAVQSFAGAWESLELPQALVEDLQRLSHRQGVTVFTTLLAAFQTLLHRYTGQEDLLVGTPTAGRTQLETEPLIGYFVNPLVLRTSLSGNPTFLELLGRTRDTMLGAFAHQEMPFEKLVEYLRLERSASHTPLIPVMFVLQNAARAQLQLHELVITPIPLSTGTAKFDLTWSVEQCAGRFSCLVEYNTDLFETARIRRMLGHFQTLAEGITSNPAQSIADLPLLTAAEHQLVTRDWNDTQTEYPRQRCIHELFEQQAAQTPEAVAVWHEGRRLTYAELNQRANQLAQVLRRLGVGPEAVVGICAERSLELIIGLLGILKAGGAYLALDRSVPPERLQFLLAEAKPRVLLAQEKCLGTWSALMVLSSAAGSGAEPQRAESSPRLLGLEASGLAFAREEATDFASGATPDNLAYVCFTSGSTGKPKGVCITHRSVVRLVKATNYARLDATEVFLQLAPVPFDASTLEIWGPLLNGGRLVIYPPGTPSLAELGAFIARHRITMLWLTAGLFHQMVEEQLSQLRAVRQLLAGGDVLSPAHVKRAAEQLVDCQIINGYGPTENTTFTCCHRVDSVVGEEQSIPIGRPIANTQVYVLDSHLHPVPIGVPGELYVAGDGLARGYLNDPALTAERFIPHPFGRTADDRLYRSGDWARWRADGCLEFLGRRDLQIKLNGFRLELGEVEAALGAHPEVRECAVAAREDAPGDKRLVGYVVARHPPGPKAEELVQFLRAKLPGYLVPSAYVPMDALPLTTNGKVDRRSLPAPGALPAEGFTAPRDDLEEQLAKHWQEVLRVQPIGIRDDFFALGGHSLLAVRLISRIGQALGCPLPVSALFQCPTIELLAQALRQPRPAAPDSLVVPIQSKGTKPPLFLVHGVGGGMFWGYGNLARYLGEDQPVFGIRSRRSVGQEELPTIEEMAAGYADELQRVQPHGPYYLGGYCFGGNVAYEIARLLEARHEPVALLLLINCTPPNSSYARVHWTPRFCCKFLANAAYWAWYFCQIKAEERQAWLRWKSRVMGKRLHALLRRAPAGARTPEVEDIVDLTRQPVEQRQLWETHIRALVNHFPKTYAGAVTLFRTRGHPLVCSFDPSCGWDKLAAGGVKVSLVPGAHESILDEPHVQFVAQRLKGCLEEIYRQQEAKTT